MHGLRNRRASCEREDAWWTALTPQVWIDRCKVDGYRTLTDDLRDQGKQISEKRAVRLASLAGIAAQAGYQRRPGAVWW